MFEDEIPESSFSHLRKIFFEFAKEASDRKESPSTLCVLIDENRLRATAFGRSAKSREPHFARLYVARGHFDPPQWF